MLSLPLCVDVIAVDPPGHCYGVDNPILLGVQCRSEVEQIRAATVTASFTLSATLSRIGADYDIKGPYVHGRKGDRFFYLSWGIATDDDPFTMFARAKLKFCDINPALLDQVADDEAATNPRLSCTLAATNEKGHPASGSIRPPRIAWSIVAS